MNSTNSDTNKEFKLTITFNENTEIGNGDLDSIKNIFICGNAVAFNS